MNKKVVIIFASLVIILGGGYAIHRHNNNFADIAPAAGDEGHGGMPQGPMPVPVETVHTQDVQEWQEFPARLSAIETVQVRPRVAGAIQEIYFDAGDMVKKGQKLFLIDPRPYQAEVSRLNAELNAARTQASLSTSQAARAQRLIKENALSQREFDERINADKVAQARIASAEAALQQAQLNVQYATITAPVSGKISRAEITTGNLVAPDAGSLLATIVSLDPIYGEFEVDERTYLTLIESNQGKPSALPVEMVLGSGNGKIYKGHVQSFDNQVNPTSGTVRARGEFENPDGALVPGLFATIRMGSANKVSAIVLGEDKVGVDQDKRFVYIVDADSKIEYRQIKLGASYENSRIITEGLKDGDRVVTSGLQMLRPGMPVQPMDAAAQQKPPEAAPQQHAQ